MDIDKENENCKPSSNSTQRYSCLLATDDIQKSQWSISALIKYSQTGLCVLVGNHIEG